jgi:hypothetical protein
MMVVSQRPRAKIAVFVISRALDWDLLVRLVRYFPRNRACYTAEERLLFLPRGNPSVHRTLKRHPTKIRPNERED